MEHFTKITASDIKINPFETISKNWFLLTSGRSEENYNTMTANWGTLGTLWNKSIVSVFVRPQRYTFQFIEANELFTISFFDNKYKDSLKLCGSASGRDINKAKSANLTPISGDNSVYFKEADLVLVCKKLYFTDLDKSNFLETKIIDEFYENKDYHRMYVAQVTNILKREF